MGESGVGEDEVEVFEQDENSQPNPFDSPSGKKARRRKAAPRRREGSSEDWVRGSRVEHAVDFNTTLSHIVREGPGDLDSLQIDQWRTHPHEVAESLVGRVPVPDILFEADGWEGGDTYSSFFSSNFATSPSHSTSYPPPPASPLFPPTLSQSATPLTFSPTRAASLTS
uniref:Uncharacterized protein n=1 Tax=Palpitomonas bilix TaxID=652834 RepID=A0A7S3DL41_9EUKA